MFTTQHSGGHFPNGRGKTLSAVVGVTVVVAAAVVVVTVIIFVVVVFVAFLYYSCMVSQSNAFRTGEKQRLQRMTQHLSCSRQGNNDSNARTVAARQYQTGPGIRNADHLGQKAPRAALTASTSQVSSTKKECRSFRRPLRADSFCIGCKLRFTHALPRQSLPTNVSVSFVLETWHGTLRLAFENSVWAFQGSRDTNSLWAP